MKKQNLFYHKRTSTQEAVNWFLTTVFIAAQVLLAVNYIPMGKTEYIIINTSLFIICALMMIFIVLPNIAKKEMFEYIIDSESIICRYPDGTGYQCKLSDIAQIEKQVVTSNGVVYHHLRLKDGSSHPITRNYKLSFRKVYSFIKKQRPDIKLETWGSY